MPLPDRSERAAVRKREVERQQKRAAEAWKANGYADHDAELAKQSKAARQKRGQAATARLGTRPGSRRTLPSSSQAATGTGWTAAAPAPAATEAPATKGRTRAKKASK